MITITLRNLKTGEVFDKVFTSPYLARVFVNKCRFSKKVRVIGTVASSFAAWEAFRNA